MLHSCPFATAALADRATVCALHLGIAEGLADTPSAAVAELLANDPRKAGCVLRIQVGADEEQGGGGKLTLRGRSGRR